METMSHWSAIRFPDRGSIGEHMYTHLVCHIAYATPDPDAVLKIIVRC